MRSKLLGLAELVSWLACNATSPPDPFECVPLAPPHGRSWRAAGGNGVGRA
jgi:hypothetical protein